MFQKKIQLRSYPEFTVEITKDGQSSLSISCRFELNELEEEGQEPENEDLFIIDEVQIHDGKTDESTFTVGSEIMDGVSYEWPSFSHQSFFLCCEI